MILILINEGETKMKKYTKNPRRRNIISTMLISIVCILLLSFLLQENTIYNFNQDNVNSPTRRLQISSSNPPEQVWNTTWGGIDDEGGRDIVLDSSENIYICGRTESFGAGGADIALLKYNNLCQKLWNATWG